MVCFAKLLNGFQLLTVFAKHAILDDWQGSEYPTELHNNIPFMQNQYTNFRKAFSENKTLKPTNEVKPTNFSF